MRSILTKLTAQGYDTYELVFDPPAAEADVRSLEQELGMSLPSSLREILTTVSRQVEFSWSVPGGLDFPVPFASNFSGNLHWSLDLLAQLEGSRQNWIETCFPDVASDYDRVWHDKLAFQEVGNGDLIAIDLRPEHAGKVVYLSHDDGEGHGLVLATSFRDFIERWVPLACTGGEDWQWLPFISGSGEGLDPMGDNARTWQALLKIA